jgi:hypothetical protein
MAKTIPTKVATNRNRSWNKFRAASVKINGIGDDRAEMTFYPAARELLLLKLA